MLQASSDVSPSGAPLQTLERALRLLHALADAPGAQTLQELGRSLGCSPSTVHRMLATLQEAQLVEKDQQSRRYRLGLGVLRLADARRRQVDLASVARPHVEALRDLTLETVSLSLLQGYETVDVERAESPLELRQSAQLGRRIPLSGLGARSRVLLAFMPREERDRALDKSDSPVHGLDRDRLHRELDDLIDTGVTGSIGERVPGAAALAAAILDSTGLPIAALVVAGPSARLTPEAMNQIQPELLRSVSAIRTEMGFTSPLSG